MARLAFRSSTRCKKDFVIAWYGRGISEFLLGRYKSSEIAFSNTCKFMESKKLDKITTEIIDWKLLRCSKVYHPFGADILAIAPWDLQLANAKWNLQRAGIMYDDKYYSDAQLVNLVSMVSQQASCSHRRMTYSLSD